MALTAEDIAYFRQLDHERKRTLAQGFTISDIPINTDHEKWLEYQKLEKLVKSLEASAAPGNEQAVGQFPSLPLAAATLMATPRSPFPNQEPNMLLNLLLRYTANVSSEYGLSCVLPRIDRRV